MNQKAKVIRAPKNKESNILVIIMKNILTFIGFLAISVQAYAQNPPPFKNIDGSTKWQHIANFSASVFIIMLLVVTIFLIFANRRAARSNRELTEIKATLEDRVARRTASLQETTAQLQSREAYITSIVDSMPLMLIGLNQNMEIIQWNHYAEAITGRPIATVLGKKLWDAYPSITLTPEQVKSVLSSKETITVKHSQRDQYYFDFTLYALTDYPTHFPAANDADNRSTNRKVETGIVILVDDITKQMKAENKLAERDKVSAMGELTSAMAYDINFPLQTLISTLVNAQHQLGTGDLNNIRGEFLEALKTAQQSGQQAIAIIQNLNELASSYHDQKQLADIPQIMDQSIELAGSLFADLSGLTFNSIDISREYSPSLPKISCFAPELKQVFIRLLRNSFHSLNTAIKHNSLTPTIHIEIGEFYDSLWIKVQHNGTGLTAEAQQDIFQPFFAMNSNVPACPVEQRLSYPYYIINDHHQGQMAVTSDSDQGTTFHIQLPIA